MLPEDITTIRGDLSRKVFAARLLEMSKQFLPFRDDIKISDRTIIKYERGERTPNPWQEFLILMYDAKNKGIVSENKFIGHLKESNAKIFMLQKKDI